MPTVLKLQLAPRAALNARTSPRLAASVSAGTGIAVSFSGGVYTVSLTTVPISVGGTGLTSFAQGDMIYASAIDTLAKLAKSTTTTHALLNTGANNGPAWGLLPLTTAVTGTLGFANGGTNSTTAQGAFDALSLKGADIPSATTLNLDNATGSLVDVTGTTQVDAVTLAEGRERWVRFTGILQLTHGASLVLPTAANITTAAGDFACFRGYASSVVRCVHYLRASGAALVGVLPTRQVISGGGLTGGGDLSTDRTLAVGAGTGITVNADDVAIANTAVTPGSYTNTNLTVDQQGRITSASNGTSGSGAARNHILNGSFNVWQRGTSFTSATTPANNDDTYLADRWILLSDGNDIVDVTQATEAPTGGLFSIGLDVETVDKKFGVLQVIEQKNCIGLIGQTVVLSFKARVTNTTRLDKIKAAIIAWDGTADTVTSDIISAWNADGTNPTLVANWTYENTPADLGVTTSWATYSVSAAVDTASTKNVGVFIWSDNVTDTDLGDFLYITDVKLEAGSSPTTYELNDYTAELSACTRYFERYGPGATGVTISTTEAEMSFPFKTVKRIAPTITLIPGLTAQIAEPGVSTFDITSVSNFVVSTHGVQHRVVFASGGTAGKLVVAYGTAPGWLNADAEL